jgi:LSD1 subclass zinc finger protein
MSATSVTCPDCRKSLRLPPGAKRGKIRCPACGCAFLPPELATAVQPKPVAPPAEEEPVVLELAEEPAPRRRPLAPPPTSPSVVGPRWDTMIYTISRVGAVLALVIVGTMGLIMLVVCGGFLGLTWLYSSKGGPVAEKANSPVPIAAAPIEQIKAVEPPKQAVAEQPKQAAAEQPKQAAAEQPKQAAAEQPKQPPAAPLEPPAGKNLDRAPAGGADAPSIPLQTLTELKGATVFIKVEAGNSGASGSGFVVKADGDTAYVVTNHHVITPSSDRLPFRGPRFIMGGGPVTITLVFGSGTPQERSAQAEVLADDADDALAVLRVKGIKDVPRPIDLRANARLVETMGLFIFGFPFGTQLATNKGNPAVTVSKGSVSSIRLNEFGELAVVQIDGDLNPGNSGGPVVDGEGRLVGVSVAKVRNTNIGMAVPTPALARLLSGRIGGTSLATRTLNNGPPETIVEARLLDPLQKIQAVSVLYVRSAGVKEQTKPDARGQWAPLPGAEKVDARIEGQKAIAKLPVKPPEKPEDAYSVQVSYVSGEGETVFLKPMAYKAQPAAPVAGGAEQPGIKPAPGQPVPQQPPKEERAQLSEEDFKQALEDLKSTDGFRRRGALDRLARAEPKGPADEVVKALEPMFGDSDFGIRSAAVKAAGVWGPKECVPALLKLLKDDSPFVRWAVLDVFGQLKDERTVEAVAECVPKDQVKASPALRAMGAMAEKAVAKLLKHADWPVRLEARNILKDIGTKESIAPLEEAAAKDQSVLVKNAARAAIPTINGRK